MTTTEPANGHPTGANERPRRTRNEPAKTSENDLVTVTDPAALKAEQERLHQVRKIEQDEIWSKVRSDSEREADREVDEKVREKERKYRRRAGKKRVWQQARHDKAQARIAEQNDRREVNLAEAQRKREELTDGSKSLAATWRTYKGVDLATTLAMIAGIAWTSHNVATGLGGQANPLYYLIEPLFSVPLLCIVMMQRAAAQNGRLHQVAPWRRDGQGRLRITRVGWIEAALLFGTTLIGVLPSLMAIGHSPFDWQLFGVRVAAPALITVAAVVKFLAAELFGPIIRDSWLDGDDEADNTRDRVRRANSLMKQVQASMAAGDMPLQEDGLPSVSTIQKFFSCEKLTAQCARDALALFSTEGQ